MTQTKYLSYGIVIALVLAIVYVFSSIGTAKAAISVFSPSNCYLNATTSPATAYAAATTTLSFLSAGTATTTSLGCLLGPDGADKAVFLLQFTGSTTPIAGSTVATTTYNVSLSYSQDGVDWYSTGTLATTTTLGWETAGGVLVASTTPTKVYVDVPTPTRYVRAVVSIPIGSTNGAVWGQLLPRQPVN